jgi:LmbE family N-acetylglucosaminyl deacetylase
MTQQTPSPEVTLQSDDRILILAPHPDDETIATGGIIQKAVAMGLPIHVAFLTYGDNNETSFMLYRKRPTLKAEAVQGMGLVRHDEAVAATGVLGLQPDQLTFLGYPDFRTLVIWTEHWGDVEPCESMFTRTKVVPYPNALRPGTPYRSEEILADVKTVLRDFKPTKVFVSHPGDHNPDHQSLYLYTRIALWDLASEMQPALYPFLVHHPEWPAPEGYHPERASQPPDRLTGEGVWLTNPLSQDQVERKHKAVQEHKSQWRLGHKLLESFMRTNELFGDLPSLVLGGTQAGVATAAGGERRSEAIPTQLTHSERAKYVGVEQRSLELDGHGNLIATIEFSRPLTSAVLASVYLFGYRPDVPFAQMPKLNLRTDDLAHAVLDGKRRLPESHAVVERSDKRFKMTVPLSLLGDPTHLLGSARTSLAAVPFDWVAWRVLELAK